jgi:chromate reductase, NAD(P)H dehydrogenase (quinone)
MSQMMRLRNVFSREPGSYFAAPPPHARTLRLLALSGSLRKGSRNTAVLKAASLVSPGEVAITLYTGLADLPAYNPDLEGNEPPAVLRLRSLLASADGLLLASPQYAHGIPGALKNALDWLAGSGALVEKPVALLAISPRDGWAHTMLAETLRTLSAQVLGDAAIPLPCPSRCEGRGGVANADLLASLRSAIARLVHAIQRERGEARVG